MGTAEYGDAREIFLFVRVRILSLFILPARTLQCRAVSAGSFVIDANRAVPLW
jgi:hypothetical protein